jgi:hypothetical protein
MFSMFMRHEIELDRCLCRSAGDGELRVVILDQVQRAICCYNQLLLMQVRWFVGMILSDGKTSVRARTHAVSHLHCAKCLNMANSVLAEMSVSHIISISKVQKRRKMSGPSESKCGIMSKTKMHDQTTAMNIRTCAYGCVFSSSSRLVCVHTTVSVDYMPTMCILAPC